MGWPQYSQGKVQHVHVIPDCHYFVAPLVEECQSVPGAGVVACELRDGVQKIDQLGDEEPMAHHRYLP